MIERALGQGIPVMCVSIMQRHEDEQLVQQHGCALLKSLAFARRDPSELCAAGAVRACVGACMRHSKQPAVLSEAFKALENLCRGPGRASETCRKQARLHGGYTAVTRRLHVGSETCRKQARLTSRRVAQYM